MRIIRKRHTGGRGEKFPRRITRTAPCAFLAGLFICACAAAVFCPAVSLNAESAESGQAEMAPAVRGSGQADAADHGRTVTVTVSGETSDPSRELAVRRINEIRLEACREGVADPRDGDALTIEDYVPLRWSAAMEEIALTRAAEATVLQDHVRPDGESCFTATAEVAAGGGEQGMEVSRMISADLETLAWGYGDVLSSIEGWYSEKEAYLSSDGEVAGHYIALINPDVLYFGAADFTPYGQRDACAGEFSFSADAGNAPEGHSGDGTAEQAEPQPPDTDSGGAAENDGGATADEPEPGGTGSMKIEIEISAENLGSVCGRAVQASADRIADRASPAALLSR